MKHRRRAQVALAGFLLLGLSGSALIALSASAGADDRPATWSGHAEGSGFRFSVIKAAALPTSDEVAGLSFPFARAETESSPVGRGIGSWVWPGELVADAKSLAAFGLDSSTAEAEVQRREQARPGHGCDPERVLSTPAVADPDGRELVPSVPVTSPFTGQPIYDPTDNPCGERDSRRALATATRERVPDYPFWAHSLWPPNTASDEADRKTVCDAPSAFPPSYEIERSACPGGTGSAEGGLVAAASNQDANSGTAQVASFSLPGLARAGEITSLARSEWIGRVLLSSSTVTINDLTLFGATGDFLHIDALVSTAVVASDDRAPVAKLQASGVSVTLGGATYAASIERDRLVVAGESLPRDVQSQMTAALNSLSRRVTFGTCAAAADCSAEPAGAAADAAPAAVPSGYDAATRTARVAGVSLVLGQTNGVDGTTVAKVSFGLAEASASTRASAPFVQPSLPPFEIPPAYSGGGQVPPPLGDEVAPGRQRPARVTDVVPVRGILPSRPVPAAVVVVAVLGMVAGGGALVAAGLWETMP